MNPLLSFVDSFFQVPNPAPVVKTVLSPRNDELAVQIAAAQVERLAGMLGYNSGGAKFPGGLNGNRPGLVLDHTALRQNARRAYHDTPAAKAIVDRFVDSVADVGLSLEPSPKADILGRSPEELEKWSADVEERFDCYARDLRQCRSEMFNFYQAQRMYQLFQHRDNDQFIRLYYDNNPALLSPLQFEFIDPFQVRSDAYTSTYFANMLYTGDGIDRDERGRETGYHIWVRTKENEYREVNIPKRDPVSGRLLMLHCFYPEYSGQGRGYSLLGYALQEFENLTDFTISVIKKAINQSAITMYVKPSSDAPATNLFEGLLSAAGAGPAATQFGANPVPDSTAANVTPESLNPVNFFDMPEATINQPGSTQVFNLKAGEDLKPFEAKAAPESYNTFVDAFVSYLAAARSMPIEVVLMKFGQNYSASRATLILFWRVCVIWRREMEASFLSPIYEMWLSEEIAASRIQCPGWSDPHLKAAWLNARWVGTPMPNIDPKQTAEADKAYVEMGAQTLDNVSRNLNGSSGKTNRARLKRELSELPDVPWSKSAAPNNTVTEGNKSGN